MSKKSIGPQLPPGFGAPKLDDDVEDSEECSPQIGPSIPPSSSIGPRLIPSDAHIGPSVPSSVGPRPPIQNEDSNDSESESGESFDGIELHDEDDLKESTLYGPALPPGFGQKKLLGPALPPGGVPKIEESDEDDDVVGPRVPGSSHDDAHWARKFEERAKRMRNKLQPKEEKVERETWMLELPKNRTGLIGLEARQFRKNAGPEKNADNSVWTDTPEEKLKKQQQGGSKEETLDPKAELEDKVAAKRDKEMAERVKAHKRDSKSLLDRHQEKSKKSKGDGSNERLMFDRDRDLQVNKFDDAQKKAVINKAKFLDDRFSAGGRKYL